MRMATLSTFDADYFLWLKELKSKIRSAQIKAALKVNEALLNFYWELGADITEKQAKAKWGDKLLSILSQDLLEEFPDVKGFSKRNLELIRKWYSFWSDLNPIAKQLATQIPWWHNVVIITKVYQVKEALFYVQKTIQNNWSRTVLTHQIESGLYNRDGQSITNFNTTLPAELSDLAQQTIKDPYCFDFLTLREKHDERELEDALIKHVTKFLLELGAGFAYIGRQIPLQVGERDFYIDLLFYHAQLHCYVVLELKTVAFEPEHTGKLNFYIKAVDMQYRKDGDNPTIGMLLCKGKDKTVVEYALSDIQKPIGVSEYMLTKSLPDKFKSSLPSIEELEAELDK